MSDLISRSKLIMLLNDYALQEAPFKEGDSADTYNAIRECIKAVEELPAVEARSVVHGEWVHSFGDEWKCSECGDVIYTEGSWDKPKAKFCEECGADMRKKVDNGNFTENGKEL